jgi:dihydropteroate synthase
MNVLNIEGQGKRLSLDIPRIMGILNITPDSFFSGSRHSVESAIKTAEKMIEQGADILDIGGQSTRPGSERISPEEEWNRIKNVIIALRKAFPSVWISVDTYHASVAKNSFCEGVEIINDISFGEDDPEMIEVIKNRDLTYIGMHKKGGPKTMHDTPNYNNICQEVFEYLKERSNYFETSGVKNIVIDPGFGFSKNIQHNFELLKNISLFKSTDRPILMGISRKSMIYKSLGISIEDSLNATTALHTFGLIQGVHILRVHDVLEAQQVIQLMRLLNSNH